MAKVQTTVQIRPDSSTPGIAGSHAHMLECLKVGYYKFDPRLQARPEQLELAADLVRANVRAFERYLAEMVRDISSHSYAVDTDLARQVRGSFDDLCGDLCGAIRRAAQTVREEGFYCSVAAE